MVEDHLANFQEKFQTAALYFADAENDFLTILALK